MPTSSAAAARLSNQDIDPIVDYLVSGYWEDEHTVEHAFDIEPGGTITVDLSGLTGPGQQFAQWGLDAWSYVTGIDFERTDSANADIVFYDEFFGASGGASYYTTGETVYAYVEISQNWIAGDIDANGNAILDSYSTQTYIHEIGHALGLGHAGPYNGDARYAQNGTGDNIFRYDSWQTTVMSYFSQTDNTATDASEAYVATPMIADILAIQELYGTPGTLRTGNDSYGENSTVGGYIDRLVNTNMAATIYDEGGIDRIDLRSSTVNLNLNLNDGSFSDIGDAIGVLAIARDTIIENALAGSGHDTITGNKYANEVLAGRGADILDGLGGNDILRGEAGNDVLQGGDGADVLTGGEGRDVASGGRGDDRIFAGPGDNQADIFSGGSGNDLVAGGGGNDTLTGDNGQDTLFGGNGDDSLIDGGTDGRGTFAFGGAGRDIVIGNDGGGDTIGGGIDNDRVQGLGGNDVIYGGAGSSGGDDDLDGGVGADTVFGGAGSDTVSGGAGNDLLYNGTGSDVVSGGNGADTLYGGSGDDRLEGGNGADVFAFVDGNGTDTIIDFEDGLDQIEIVSGAETFADLDITAQNNNALVSFGAVVLVLEDVAPGALSADDFVFS